MKSITALAEDDFLTPDRSRVALGTLQSTESLFKNKPYKTQFSTSTTGKENNIYSSEESSADEYLDSSFEDEDQRSHEDDGSGSFITNATEVVANTAVQTDPTKLLGGLKSFKMEDIHDVAHLSSNVESLVFEGDDGTYKELTQGASHGSSKLQGSNSVASQEIKIQGIEVVVREERACCDDSSSVLSSDGSSYFSYVHVSMPTSPAGSSDEIEGCEIDYQVHCDLDDIVGERAGSYGSIELTPLSERSSRSGGSVTIDVSSDKGATMMEEAAGKVLEAVSYIKAQQKQVNKQKACLLQANEKLVKEKDQLKQQLKEEKSKLKVLVSECKDALSHANDRIQVIASRYDNRILDLKGQINCLSADMDASKSDNASLGDALEKKNAEINQLLEQVTALSEKNAKLEEALCAQEVDHDMLQKMRSDLVKARVEVMKFQTRYDNSQSRAKLLETEKEECAEHLRLAEEKIKKLGEEKAKLQESLGIFSDQLLGEQDVN